MTNFEKYKTAQERSKEFYSFCGSKEMCDKCPLIHEHQRNMNECRFAWLDLEAEEEKPLPCPFCGSRMIEEKRCDYGLVCAGCEYTTPFHKTIAEAIAAHNRVAKKCEEVKE